jgi:Flp pilus assembly protein TadG
MRGAPRSRDGGERGSSAIELVLYTPLIFFTIFVIVQFGLLYLGNQAASAAAREAARAARNGGGDAAALDAAAHSAQTIGRGVFTPTDVAIEPLNGGTTVKVTVRGHGMQIVPGVPLPDIVQVVQGPMEEFRADTP